MDTHLTGEKDSEDLTTSLPDISQTELPLEKWITGWKLTAVFTGITVVSFLMLLDMSIISTVSLPGFRAHELPLIPAQAIPRITSDFHSLDDVGWYGSSYQLAR